MMVTDRVSREGKAIPLSVRLSIGLFPLCLLNQLAFEFFVWMWVITIVCLQLKVKVNGQCSAHMGMVTL